MDNLQLVETTRDLDFIRESLAEPDFTSMPDVKEFDQKSKNQMISFVMSGALLLSMPSEASTFEIPTEPHGQPENLLSFLNSYNSKINTPIAAYIEEVNSISIKQNYTKREVISEILSFKSLSLNWDGFGAYPLEVESASNALYLMDLIGESVFCAVDELYPNPHGTISLIWYNKGGECVSVEVGNKELSYYVKLSSKDTQYFNNVQINDQEAKRISKFIQSL